MTMILNRRIGIGFLLFAFLLLSSSSSSSSSSSFSPSDEYLINCGSNVDSTVDNRRFVSDTSKSNLFFTSEVSIALHDEDEDLSPNIPQIYKSARIFAKQSKYEVNLNNKGTHMVRLHFNRFNSSKIDLGNAQFHVTVNNHVVLTNFTGDDSVREYLIWVDVVGEIVIRFIPSNDSKFAFVNAIEVISAPKDLIADVATSVLSSDNKTEKFHGLVKQAMEVCYRINVGGFKVTPFNDTLWRTWITDDEFFKTTGENGVSSEKVYFTGRIKYRNGGASREIGPDNVYNTARIAKRRDTNSDSVDMRWDFAVSSGYKYLIRLHFCDIASKSLNLLYFNVYINGKLAFEDFDISSSAENVLASPYYVDFVVEVAEESVLSVSVGPSNKTIDGIDSMLNGIEIMKMNNSMGSLDGGFSTDMVISSSCPNRRNLGIFVAMMAFMCMFMSVYYIVMSQRKKKNVLRDDFGWTKLSMEDNHQFAVRKI